MAAGILDGRKLAQTLRDRLKKSLQGASGRQVWP